MEACISSDHNAVRFDIGEKPDEPTARNSTYFFNNKTADWNRFHEVLAEEMADLCRCETVNHLSAEELEIFIADLTKAIRSACRKSMKLRGNTKQYNPWWTDELEAQKKEVIRLHHRIQTRKNRQSDITDTVRQHQEAKTAYAKAIKKAATAHFRAFCQAQGKENVWELTARLFKDAPRRRPPPH